MAVATFGYNQPIAGPTISGTFGGGSLGGTDTSATVEPNLFGATLDGGGSTLGASTTGGGYTYDAAAAARQAEIDQSNAYIDQQLGNLRDLLGRADTGLNQGLTQLNDSYQSNKTTQDNLHGQANQDYADKRVATNKDRQGAYGAINKNASNGYRSLSQIIGRASGTGSSAFREALPDAIGRETSGKRTEANQTYGTNMGNIDTAQKKTDLSFENILRDLENQRRSQEGSLRTGVEQQKQALYGQQQQLEAQRGNLAGAQALQGSIEGSRNSVESFFNQFKPTMVAQQAAIAAPDLNKYTVDRANVNAQKQGGDATNPYADILRKKLQEGAV